MFPFFPRFDRLIDDSTQDSTITTAPTPPNVRDFLYWSYIDNNKDNDINNNINKTTDNCINNDINNNINNNINNSNNMSVIHKETTPWCVAPILRPATQPRPGQIIYAMYILHCRDCTVPLSMCRFPGCSIIRSKALLVLQKEEEEIREEKEVEEVKEEKKRKGKDWNAGNDKKDKKVESKSGRKGNDGIDDRKKMMIGNKKIDLSLISKRRIELFNTGKHPIEKEIRKYLLSYSVRALEEYVSPVFICHTKEIDVTSEISQELQLINENMYKERYLNLLKSQNLKLKIDAKFLRYISRRCVNPSLTQVISTDEVRFYDVIFIFFFFLSFCFFIFL